MAKQNEKQLIEDYKRVQNRNKELEKENQKLKSTEDALEVTKKEVSDEKQKLTALQGQFSELLKKTQSLEKTVSGHTDPKVLRDTLEIAEKSAKEKESKNQDLQKQVSVLQKEKQDLLSKDDLSAEAMQQVQEKDKEIKRLENELISAKKKKAKYEGDFRFPSGGASLLSVPMGEGKVAEAMLYTPKQPAGAPPIIVTAITQDGKAVSVDFKKA